MVKDPEVTGSSPVAPTEDKQVHRGVAQMAERSKRFTNPCCHAPIIVIALPFKFPISIMRVNRN